MVSSDCSEYRVEILDHFLKGTPLSSPAKEHYHQCVDCIVAVTTELNKHAVGNATILTESTRQALRMAGRCWNESSRFRRTDVQGWPCLNVLMKARRTLSGRTFSQCISSHRTDPAPCRCAGTSAGHTCIICFMRAKCSDQRSCPGTTLLTIIIFLPRFGWPLRKAALASFGELALPVGRQHFKILSEISGLAA